MKTILEAVLEYEQSVGLARSTNTPRTYRNGMDFYLSVVKTHKIDAAVLPVDKLPEDSIIWFTVALKDSAPTTERLYLTVATGFFEFLAANNLAPINLPPRAIVDTATSTRRPGQRLPQFPHDDIDTVLEFASTLSSRPAEDQSEHLRNLRDYAFLVALADTGLRVHEACNLRRGDIDWNEGRAVIIGKGNRQAVVRFSRRSQAAMKEYLAARSSLDGSSGKPLSALPLFARHDRGAGSKIKPITTATGRNIVTGRVHQALGENASRITPHSFRHYFVTRVLQNSGNLKLAQELARHRNIAVTQRYAHLSDNELDKGYWDAIEKGEKTS